MSVFEYIIPIVSIVVGLAITDLSASFHRLLRERKKVKWDWLPLLLALNLLLLILINWWYVYGASKSGAYDSLAVFIPLIISFLLQYIWTASVLPDHVSMEGLDLKKYYAENISYIWWSGFSVLIFGAFANAIRIAAGYQYNISFFDLILTPDIIKLLIFSTFTIMLALIKRRAFHAVMIILMLAFLIIDAIIINESIIG